ncbi:hypothetical protein COX05_04590 [candidate division WWE3 bacterium CG22_combo_CG10-13_8_21_14_all_39_12]|uniref:Uncharacterized protein n=1 Tax=candidate division WWE3 bacterium CG22_combo_CG10-13_8_21_14_all_39_12 TaxID=1975094 RepID=A0A2H0BEQ6_UNCKA|nr:MAG: hypothetical protein COX05_04590 [candidate division WWE3 bacterium CG22_combo_CG10-13_8_21_14_all_39_12]
MGTCHIEYSINKTYTVNAYDFDVVNERLVNFEIGLGSLEVTGDPTSTDVFVVDSHYSDSWGEPIITQEYSNQRLSIFFSQKDNHSFGFPQSPDYHVDLGATDIQSSFIFDVGAGSATVDVESLTIDTITAKVGLGSFEINLPRSIRGSIALDVGLGSAKISIPDTSGFKVKYSVGAGQLAIDGNDVATIGSDGVYTSNDYDGSTSTIDFTIDVGLGSVSVERMVNSENDFKGGELQ